MNAPKRGEIWLLDLNTENKITNSRAKTKTCLCLVVSTEAGEYDHALASVLPHSTVPRNTRFEVEVAARSLPHGGVFDAQCLVTVPLARFERKIALVTLDDMERVDTALMFWLGL